MAAAGWPARLGHGPVTLRPMRLRDAGEWVDVRRRNEDWLRPWEATPPGQSGRSDPSVTVYLAMRRDLNRKGREGSALPFALFYEARLVGQVTIATVVRGSLNSGHAGYWIDSAVAGRGIMPIAVALAVDHCFERAGLHRVEANIRPENAASRRVVEKLGFREEGLRRRYLHIDGSYRDHISYAVTVEDAPAGLLSRALAAAAR